VSRPVLHAHLGSGGRRPKSWKLEGSYDGSTWTTADERTDQTFDWRLADQTVQGREPGRYKYYRLSVTANTGEASTTLAEVELLGHTAPACTTTISDKVTGAG